MHTATYTPQGIFIFRLIQPFRNTDGDTGKFLSGLFKEDFHDFRICVIRKYRQLKRCFLLTRNFPVTCFILFRFNTLERKAVLRDVLTCFRRCQRNLRYTPGIAIHQCTMCYMIDIKICFDRFTPDLSDQYRHGFRRT